MIQDLDTEKQSILVKPGKKEYEAIRILMEENKQTNSIFIHELRNPLSLIKATLQYIEMKHPEAKDFKYWSQLYDLVLDMDNMISDASILNSCTTPNMKQNNLLKIIRDTVENYKPQAYNQGKTLILKEAPECKTLISSYYCDSSKIKQVISNLLKNALEATESGNSINVIISFIPKDSHSMVSIQVNNNGLPIPKEDIDTIFLPFVTRKKEGTGIGLAFVSRVIKSHGGSIKVTSNDELTSFTILLPLYS